MLKTKRGLLTRVLCFFLCTAIILTGLPVCTDTAQAAVQTKFIKAEPEVFVPTAGEKARISFNLETTKTVDIYVKDGKKKIADLVKGKKYKGGYTVHRLQWDGRDNNGNYVNSGTYKIVVEPNGKYSKYKSVTSVCAAGDNSKEICIAPNTQGNRFKIYGAGGKNQGIKNVSLSVKKDGKAAETLKAEISDNLWYAQLTMADYSLYDITAQIQGKAGTSSSSISAAVHAFRVTDQMEYLAAAYYGDYKKAGAIEKDNGIQGAYVGSGELVGFRLLLINPLKKIKQEITDESHTKGQHLGIIDQLQGIASRHPSSLTMGNHFYTNEDLAIEGYIPLHLSRSYNSMSESFHEFGMGWSHSYTCYLQDLGGAATVRFGDGHIETYTKKTDGTYEKPEGMARTLKAGADGIYVLTVDGGTRYVFRKDGRLKKTSDLNGNETLFAYTDGLLSKVENASGYFCFTYNKDGTVRSVKDSGEREIQYTYTDGLLTGFTDAQGNQTTYSYDSQNRMNRAVSPEKVVLFETVYDALGRVRKKTVQGGVYTYRYNEKERTITCTEPNGRQITFRYTPDYRIQSEEYPDGIVRYAYAADNREAKEAAFGEENETEKAVVFSKTSSRKEAGAATGSAIQLKLQTQNINSCTGDAKYNTLYPQFRILNTGEEDIDLSGLTLRYYYTIDGKAGQKFWCDWSTTGRQNVTGKFIRLKNPQKGADHYLEIGFTEDAGKLQAGSAADLHTRITKTDWDDFLPGDDYSQNLSENLSYFDQVDMFYKGSLVWGKGGISGEGDLVTDQDTEEDTGGSAGGGTGGSTENSGEEEILPEGLNHLKLQMYNEENSGSHAGTIHPKMKLVNLGENMIKLSDVKIRYYYTADNDKPQKFWCDWSDAGNGAVTGTFQKLDKTFEGADTCLEIGFTQEAGWLDIGASIRIHTRFAKEDWSEYDLTNDHSIHPAFTYEDWEKVDVFLNGEKVWGEDLTPDTDEKLETGHMDYADDTYTPVRVQMYNRNRESRTNQISVKFRVYNIQEAPIRLSDLRLNYFYTADGPEEQIFEVDWAGIGSSFSSHIRNSDVTCQFTKVDEGNPTTQCIADIGFIGDDKVIRPGEYLELQFRIHRPDWTRYVQSNDYSLNPDGKDFEDWNQTAVFLNGRWVYGTIPLSLAERIDPDPEADSTPQYPSDAMESSIQDTDKAGNTTAYTHDENGNVTSVTDALGNRTVYTYNKWSQVTSQTDAMGNKTTYSYDGKGNLLSVKDAMGNITRYAYNEKGYLVKETRADGSTAAWTYDDKGNIKTVTDGNGDTVHYEYDTLNRVTTCKDARGGVTKYKYSANGDVTQVTDALGYAQKTAYNKDGRVIREIGQTGNRTVYQYEKGTGRLKQTVDALSGRETYEYDSMGNLVKETAPDGGITTYTYDLSGRMTAATDALGGETAYTYDQNGNLVTETDALGNTTAYIYDKQNRITGRTDGEGNTTLFQYDALGRTIKETDPSGGILTYRYDKAGNITRITDSLGNAVQYTYNKNGMPKSITDAEGNRTEFEYDGEGQKTKEIAPSGSTRLWEYDKNGNLIRETDENGNRTVYTYDKENQVTTRKDALGNTTRYEYDGCGSLLSETNALGHKTAYTYDALGNRTSMTNESGKTFQYSYDPCSRLIKETDPKGNVTAYGYDKNGNQIRKTDALGKTFTYKYDQGNRLTEEIGPAGNKTAYSYDANGNILCRTDARGNKTFYTYDASSCLTEVTDALGNRTKYSYDRLGNLTGQTREGKTRERDQTTHYQYDRNGRITRLTAPAGQSTAYQYDVDGRLVKETGSDKTTVRYQYDKAGNKKKVVYSDSRSITYTYTKIGQVKTVKDWNGTSAYEYDACGQVTKITDAEGQVLKYTWTKTGQKKSIQYPDGKKVSYTYDSSGNLASVTDTSGGVTKYTYDALDRVKKKVLPNGAKSTYSYDNSDRLSLREETGRNLAMTYHYKYDENGNRTEERRTSPQKPVQEEIIRYTYDASNRLTGATDSDGTRSYTFDEFDNRTAKKETGKADITYTYNRLNQLTAKEQGQNRTTFTYDKKGNLKETRENGVLIREYVTDSAGRLSQAVIRDSGSKALTVCYTYDGAGNRIGKKVLQNGRVTSDTAYVTDPESSYGSIIMAKDRISGKSAVFTFGEEAVSVQTDGKICYYGNDDRNSVTELLDKAGKIKASIEYDEYGLIKNPEAIETGGNLFAYTGYAYEKETGLYDAKARYYDAETGRFTSRDSYQGDKSQAKELNQYVYARNNPATYTDPGGNITIVPAAVIALVFVVGGMVLTVKVRGDYLMSKEGKELLDSANQVIYKGKTYLAKQFKKLVTWTGKAVKKGIKALDKAVASVISWIKKQIGKEKGEEKTKEKKKGKEKKKDKGESNTPDNVNYNSKQVGKKYGEHIKDYPDMKDYTEYKDYADEIFKSPDQIIHDAKNGEFYYTKGNDLLRIKENGDFVSLYPGAESGRVLDAISNGGVVWP